VETVIEKPWSNQSDTCKEWVAEQAKAGREVVSKQDLENAVAAKRRLEADEQISTLLAACDRQVWVMAEWSDDETGLRVPVQCLIDLATRREGNIIGDLKSTKNAAVAPWERWARKVGYEIQAAWNLDMFKAATNRDIKQFCFILSESHAPFEIGRRYMEVDEAEPEKDSFRIPRRDYKAAMNLYCKCLKADKWPGYDDTDAASLSGWTLLSPDPWDEQRRMFAPQFVVEAEADEQEIDDIIP
jgi:hypothetical protein